MPTPTAISGEGNGMAPTDQGVKHLATRQREYPCPVRKEEGRGGRGRNHVYVQLACRKYTEKCSYWLSDLDRHGGIAQRPLG